MVASETVPAQPREDRRFLRRITFTTAWGQGLDGYDLGIISVVLIPLSAELDISPMAMGLIGAAALVGIFIGGPVFGYLTDRFGRRKLFNIDILLFLVAGIAQGLVGEGWQLVIVRLVLGMAIGAEYSIGAPMLAEFSPARGRGRRLSMLEVCWFSGFLASVLVGYALLELGVGWRLILVTSAVPALVTLVLRHGMPESPRWLIAKGRTDEARAIVDRYMGGEAYFAAEQFADESQRSGTGIRALFSRELRGRTIFVCVFWACQVAPYFAIFTFAPQVLSSLDLTNETAGTIATNGLAALGAVVGMLVIERIGRRRMLVIPFWIQAAALFVVGFWAGAPTWVIIAAFVFYAFFNALSSNLEAVYPAELFPTSVRTTGVGVATAASRIGAAIGTWLLPVGLDTIGVGPCMVIGGLVCVLGAIVSQVMAPETTGKSLTDSARTAASRTRA
ncbi:MFS transporter [Pseudonocardia sp. MH-G8]|uniref:MFS transporter n=1 Tax=Pseudonocardia sp. MH-G8 TaxID=1854588 RepID=UPI000BA14476|nr:MFS transporter [Pseudonocardia sp. MH-G8]OZM81726.1 MFS transporter [Pseudonocardia sp. MH-G8]